MCAKLDILSETPRGYIGWCQGCQKLNINYGTFLMTLKYSDLETMISMLENGREHFKLSPSLPRKKTYLIQTPVTNLFMSFTAKEFEELLEMFLEAQYVLSLRDFVEEISF